MTRPDGAVIPRSSRAAKPRRKRRSSATRTAGHDETAAAPDHAGSATVTPLSGSARIYRLRHGLYSILVGALPPISENRHGPALPLTVISRPASGEAEPAADDADAAEPAEFVFRAEGGRAIIKITDPIEEIVVISYGIDQELEQYNPIYIESLDNTVKNDQTISQILPSWTVNPEITLYIDRLGIRRFRGTGWAGSRRLHLPFFGLAVHGGDDLTTMPIEYRAFGWNGTWTEWKGNGELAQVEYDAGPLKGFAVRVGAAYDAVADVVYYGRFRTGQTVGPCRNAEACVSSVDGDPLVAVAMYISGAG